MDRNHKTNAPVEYWDADIIELEQFFSDKKGSLRIDTGSMITDMELFATTHLSVLKTNNGNKTFLPYLKRLQQVRALLTNKIK